MEYWIFQTLVVTHVIGATIWTGGHIVLSITVLQKALKQNNKDILLDFEILYEKVGIPALLFQIISGIILSFHYSSNFLDIFRMENSITTLITYKFILLLTTIIIAAHAKFKILPNLTKEKLPLMAKHIYITTIISILYIAFGVLIRL